MRQKIIKVQVHIVLMSILGYQKKKKKKDAVSY